MNDADEVEAMAKQLEAYNRYDDMPGHLLRKKGAAMLRQLAAEIERLRAENAEFRILLDAARLLIKSRDQQPDEMKVYDAIRVSLAKYPPPSR